MKRAVITGIGIISSIGNNIKDILFNLKNGCSGIVFSKKMKDAGMRSNVCGNIKLNKDYYINYKHLRFMNKSTIYAYLSMKEAIKSSGLNTSIYENNPSVGIIIGSSGNYPNDFVKDIKKMHNTKNIKSISPYLIMKYMFSNISACLSTFFKIKGISYSISSACSTSANCIGYATEQIKLGKQNIMFAGGSEEISWEMSCTFDAIGALSTKFNNQPNQSSRPYDINRDGFVISGGCGIIIIEELQHALYRNAKIFAEIVGYGINSNGNHMIIPDELGIMNCMKLSMCNINEPIDYLNTHGTSTKIGDIKELIAIKKTFKNNIPYISSTKSITGHSLGASGVQEIIYSIIMLENNFIAPSMNIKNIEQCANNMNIVTKLIKKKLNIIMSNSLGFGGTNVTLIIKKFFY